MRKHIQTKAFIILFSLFFLITYGLTQCAYEDTHLIFPTPTPPTPPELMDYTNAQFHPDGYPYITVDNYKDFSRIPRTNLILSGQSWDEDGEVTAVYVSVSNYEGVIYERELATGTSNWSGWSFQLDQLSDLPGGPDNSYSFDVIAVDDEDQEYSIRGIFYIDDPPNITINNLDQNQVIKLDTLIQTYIVQGNVFDDYPDVTVEVIWGDRQPKKIMSADVWNFPINLPNVRINETFSTIEVKATDSIGQESETLYMNIIFDVIAPHFQLKRQSEESDYFVIERINPFGAEEDRNIICNMSDIDALLGIFGSPIGKIKGDTYGTDDQDHIAISPWNVSFDIGTALSINVDIDETPLAFSNTSGLYFEHGDQVCETGCPGDCDCSAWSGVTFPGNVDYGTSPGGWLNLEIPELGNLKLGLPFYTDGVRLYDTSPTPDWDKLPQFEMEGLFSGDLNINPDTFKLDLAEGITIEADGRIESLLGSDISSNPLYLKLKVVYIPQDPENPGQDYVFINLQLIGGIFIPGDDCALPIYVDIMFGDQTDITVEGSTKASLDLDLVLHLIYGGKIGINPPMFMCMDPVSGCNMGLGPCANNGPGYPGGSCDTLHNLYVGSEVPNWISLSGVVLPLSGSFNLSTGEFNIEDGDWTYLTAFGGRVIGGVHVYLKYDLDLGWLGHQCINILDRWIDIPGSETLNLDIWLAAVNLKLTIDPPEIDEVVLGLRPVAPSKLELGVTSGVIKLKIVINLKIKAIGITFYNEEIPINYDFDLSMLGDSLSFELDLGDLLGGGL